MGMQRQLMLLNLMTFFADIWGWKNGVAEVGRQGCANARCCLLLLQPRLANKLLASGKTLEGWKRLAPALHYLPIPYHLTLGLVSFMLSEGELGAAVATWLAFRALLRPGEALALRVRDIVIPGSIVELSRGCSFGGTADRDQNRGWGEV